MNARISKIEQALDALEPLERECTLCPRECRVDRKAGRTGTCQTGSQAVVSHALLHYGEEPVLSGFHDCAEDRKDGRTRAGGSGTIFFACCNLKCLFCQNYQLSWQMQGQTVNDDKLAAFMICLQEQGAYNINLVSPTHVIVPILRALKIACAEGLSIPIVYNSNGYDKIDVIEKLGGILDIYLPDIKYFSPKISKKFSGAPYYFFHAGPAVQEMFFQQPDFVLSDEGIARLGCILRHLILPGHVEDSLAILDWVAEKFPPTICLSLMSQYHPCFRAPEEIQRPLTASEYRTVVVRAKELGF